MKRFFAAVFAIALTSGAAAAQPLGSAPLLHPVHGTFARRAPVRTVFAPAGTDQVRGLLIAALLVGAAGPDKAVRLGPSDYF